MARVLLLCLLAVSAGALKLPAQERLQELENRRHRRPLTAPRTPPTELHRFQTVPPSRLSPVWQDAPEAPPRPEGQPRPEAEREAPQQSSEQEQPESKPEQKPEPNPEPEPNVEQEPKAEQEPEKVEPVPEQARTAVADDGDGSLTDKGVDDSPPDVGPDQDEVPPPAATSPGGSKEAPSPIQSNRQEAPMTQQVDEPKIINADQTSGGDSSDSTTDNAVVTREPVPDKAYAVFDSHGHICILATLMVDLEIIYYTEYDERKKVTVSLPEDADVTGSCARDGATPEIRFTWDNVMFSILFNENEFGNTWYVSDMKLEYSLDDSKFPEARPVGRQKLWMDVQKQHTLHLFASPVDKAYFCTSEQDLDLFNGDGVRSATIILWNVHLQPYVKNGQFGASVNCPGGKVGRRRINEAVPMAVGSTLAAVTLVTIAGYAVWRHFRVKKFNYDTME